MSGGAARRRCRRLVRARRTELAHLDAAVAYQQVVDEARAGAFGPSPDGEGWVYEDFHLADKDAVFAAARAGGAVEAHQLAAASRLYTPAPIVDFILENTLGALWLAMHPESRLAGSWPMLVPGAVGPPIAARPLRELRVLDPCCGAGAFLTRAATMLRALAAEERGLAAAGLVPPDWPLAAAAEDRHIVGHMIVGADIDARALAIADAEIAAAAGGSRPRRLSLLDGPLGSLAPDAFGSDRFDVVCTNPPWIGFRQLAADVKDAVLAAVPGATSDLAIATQARAQDLVADGGRIGTVTPAAWLAARPAQALRERILADGGPVLVAQLGQGVFGAAPLVFVAASVVARGVRPADLVTLRGRAGAEAVHLADMIGTEVGTPRDVIAALPRRPFVVGAPAEVLAHGIGAGRRVGDVASTFDGIWTGDNGRDLRYWWEIDDLTGWRSISGGQGFHRWLAPTYLRIRHEVVADQPNRDGCLEYARVAGGRLGVRVAQPGTAALAGIVTIVPRPGDAEALTEVIAVCNSAVGAGWVATLTAGLNFNPGSLAQIPLGSGGTDAGLREIVDRLIELRRGQVARDPAHEGFVDVPAPWDDDLDARLRSDQAELETRVAAYLGLGAETVARLDTVRVPDTVGGIADDFLLVAVLRAVGFGWPGGPDRRPVRRSRDEVVDAVATALRASGAPGGAPEPAAWVRDRLDGVLKRRFRGRGTVAWDGRDLVIGPPRPRAERRRGARVVGADRAGPR